MKQQLPQITRRRIGSVVIIDIKGELVGPWALKAKESIAQLLSENIKNLIINIKELQTVDSLGVKAISENLHENSRNALISGKISVMEMFSRLNVLNNIKVFDDENGIISFFGKEFVENNNPPFIEKRNYSRLNTAIPLEFYYNDSHEQMIVFKAIVTDLSEGGLFAEYLDLETVDTVNKRLDPYDLKMLELKIKLPHHDYIYASGKVLRTIITGEQLGLGIEFYKIAREDKQIIIDFLSV
ncbi:MAG: PilZ domain-containing protein [Candidatus Omnitrophica bacterium]|nr:PilZ domain-containing protein [Candidatus Omnitrophota bacterium]